MTNMSRVERRKAQNLYEDQNAALADDYVDDGESLPTRQSVKNQREQKKKQGKTKTPLFTVLAVIFVFVPVIVLVTLFYLKSHPDNHDDYEDVFIDSSQSKYEVVPKSEDKNDTADTKETALQNESKKEPEDSKPKEPAKTADDKKQTAVAEKEDSANKEEATAAAASSSQSTVQQQEQQQQPAEPVQNVPNRVVKHTVQKKETLYRISMKYYKSRTGEEKIRAYNHLNGNDVYTGQVLDIPLMDE
ncbi:LysM peptidoglycan-binding domain-containing protein [Bacillus subtilis]|uniref:LysM peptidoglycan-binding domain-containing protein n=1 Tax=Bacillus subtilis TaxID=1423 RepID=UPI002DBFD686|nr:LysM peptidoglycan-binding domain-containing protein [Bacillus subtilis]MEC1432772.1 LysM peptidoglycan-binding domain-containing protein [Bacillus subtilis]